MKNCSEKDRKNVGPSSKKTERVSVIAGNMILLSHAEAIRLACKQKGLPLVMIKGAAFLDTLYNDLSQRSMCDLDVFTLRSCKKQVRQVMSELGFREKKPAVGRESTWDEHYNTAFELPRSPGVMVELHTELCQSRRYPGDYEAMVRRSRVIKTKDRLVPTFDAEDSVLSLILHGTKHFFSHDALRLEDCARIFEEWNPSPIRLLERIKDSHLDVPAYWYLSKLNAYRRVEGCESILEPLKPSSLRNLFIEKTIEWSPKTLLWARVQQTATMALTDSYLSDLALFTVIYGRRRTLDTWGKTLRRFGLS